MFFHIPVRLTNGYDNDSNLKKKEIILLKLHCLRTIINTRYRTIDISNNFAFHAQKTKCTQESSINLIICFKVIELNFSIFFEIFKNIEH